jgi:GntR family transcriptional regulator/MocR family aminotransferase
MDRVFALVRPGAPVDHQRPHWAKKGLFVMLMLEEGLARVKTSLDVETLRLSILDGNAERLSADLGDPEQRAAVEDFILSLVPSLKAPPRLVKAAEGHFMDKPDNVISLINLATLRSLEEQWGYAIDPLRFRANLYVDGLEPWAEFDWIDQEIRIGDATFRVDRRNGRCSATNVNPLDGRRDLDIPGALRASFGHKNLGVYLLATSAGRVAVGDRITGFSLRRGTGAPAPSPLSTQEEGRRRFICRGCYFIYAEAEGVPQDHIAPGTPFAAIDAAWRCPDCGTDKSIFRSYMPERSFG